MLDTSQTDKFLYIITPSNFNRRVLIKKLISILQFDCVGALQLRFKNSTEEEIISLAKEIYPICQDNKILCIINDRPDLARDINLDGVHIGEEDTSLFKAREIVGSGKVIGVSCYNSIDRAMTLAEQGADYVAFGSFYETKTKRIYKKANINLLKNWSLTTNIPVVAIGGIKPENSKVLVKAGADFLAVCSSVWESSLNPENVIRSFYEIKKNLYMS